MQSYLTNRKQYVEINNTKSTKKDITFGVITENAAFKV